MKRRGARAGGRLAREGLPAPGLVFAGGRRHTAETIWRAWAQNKSPRYRQRVLRATLTAYIDDHDRHGTKQTLADLVGRTLVQKGGA